MYYNQSYAVIIKYCIFTFVYTSFYLKQHVSSPETFRSLTPCKVETQEAGSSCLNKLCPVHTSVRISACPLAADAETVPGVLGNEVTVLGRTQ